MTMQFRKDFKLKRDFFSMQDIEHSIVQINFFIMKIPWHL